jgi:hypothetical protein
MRACGSQKVLPVYPCLIFSESNISAGKFGVCLSFFRHLGADIIKPIHAYSLKALIKYPCDISGAGLNGVVKAHCLVDFESDEYARVASRAPFR